MRGKKAMRWWPWLLSHTRYAPVPQDHTAGDVENLTSDDQKPKDLQKRHILIGLSFLGFAVVYAMRVNLSVAIVAMVKRRHTATRDDQVVDACPAPEGVARAVEDGEKKGEFEWDEQTQGMVLGCFFYGYLLTNYLGGRLAERFGGRLVYGLGVTLTAALTILSPYAARHSTGAFVFIRILEGMTEGVTFPSINVMMSYWIPPQERARSMTLIMGGCQFGTVVTLSASGWLSQTELGWPAVFQVFGWLGLAWGVLWFRYIHDSPDQHPDITAAEKIYIKNGVGDHRKNESLAVPWHSILTSTPFLVVVVTHVGNNWGFYCLLTELPTYLKNIQHYDMKSNGVVSALPYLLMWLFSLAWSRYMDQLLHSARLSNTQIRRLSMAVGNYIPLVAVVLVPWAGCDGRLAVALICLAVGASGATFCGFHCAFQELAPNFAGTLTGISNTMATIPGFLAPEVTGAIINNQQTLSNWREVFQVVAVVYLVVCSLYLAFVSTEVQPWNEGRTEKKKPVNGEVG